MRLRIQGRHQAVRLSIAGLILFFTAGTVHAAAGQTADYYGWLSLLPPVVAIALALVLREVISSLLAGILVGSIIISPADPGAAIIRIPTDLIWNALSNSGHAAIVLFSLMLAGMVGILSRSGGTAGIVAWMSRMSSSRRGGQLMTYFLGLVIFFDDYANTLLVGQTMRPYTDRLKISRAKLAYIVDSTAAPVASIALVSTWIGFEVGLLGETLTVLGETEDAYILFLRSIPYHFYSILALVLVFLVTLRERDYGAMLRVEREALAGNDSTATSDTTVEREEAPVRGYYGLIALVPVVLVIVATFAGLFISGKEVSLPGDKLFEIIGSADSSAVLLASSFLGMVTAALLALLLTEMKLDAVSDAALNGIKSMVPAITILLLAWALGEICDRLGTAQVIINAVTGRLPPFLVPGVVFLVAAAVAFSTGTSWGAMAILIPLAIPLAYHLPELEGLPDYQAAGILLGSVGAVLAGATFGDHCSPISDTTIMSSMATGCNHVDHVRTQILYAVIAGTAAFTLGYLPAGLGMPGWIGLVAGAAALLLVTKMFKKP